MTKTTPVFIAQTFGNGKTREDFKRERLHLSAVAGNKYGAVMAMPFESIDEKETASSLRMRALGRNIMSMSGVEVAVFSSDWKKSEMCRYLHSVAIGYGMEVIESYSDWRDDMTKSLPERLRATADEIDKSGYQRPICAMRKAIGYGECENSNRCSSACDKGCLSRMLNLIAYDVDSGYIKLPSFADDGARDLFIKTLAEMADANVSKVVRVNRDDMSAESLKLVFEPPKDTLEAIERDAWLCYSDYARKHDGVSCSRDMIADLLRRQRAVLERDAPKAEERTCRDVEYVNGLFECSECGNCCEGDELGFCPYCGARVVK